MISDWFAFASPEFSWECLWPVSHGRPVSGVAAQPDLDCRVVKVGTVRDTNHKHSSVLLGDIAGSGIGFRGHPSPIFALSAVARGVSW